MTTAIQTEDQSLALGNIHTDSPSRTASSLQALVDAFGNELLTLARDKNGAFFLTKDTLERLENDMNLKISTCPPSSVVFDCMRYRDGATQSLDTKKEDESLRKQQQEAFCPKGATALHYAMQWGSTDLARFLLEMQGKIIFGGSGGSPSVCSPADGDVSAATSGDEQHRQEKTLLQKQLANSRTDDGDVPLQLINRSTHMRLTPAYESLYHDAEAFEEHILEKLKLMAAYGANVFEYEHKNFKCQRSIMETCSGECNLSIVRFLLEDCKYDVSRDLNAFFIAAESGHVEVVEMMLAAEKRRFDSEKCVQGDDDDEVVEEESTRHLRRSVINMIGSPSSAYSDSSALNLAVTNGRTDMVQYLLDNGADVNFTYDDGVGKQTLLFVLTCVENGEDIAPLLIDCGIDVGYRQDIGGEVSQDDDDDNGSGGEESRGLTAYEFAVEEGCDDLAEVLKPETFI